MPSSIVPRGDRFGARITRRVRGKDVQEWLGTFDSERDAILAVERARVRKRKPRRERPPAEADVDRLVECARARDREDVAAFILVAAWSGLRLFEVAALEARDLFIPAPEETMGKRACRLHVRHGKGDKPRTVALLDPAAVALDAMRPWRQEGAVLRNQAGHPFRRQAINRVWSGEDGRPGIRDDAGLPRAVFHDLRKFHATWLLDHGASDLDVAIQLGHFDSLGRPDTELVRRIYGFPNHREALARLDRLGVQVHEPPTGAGG